MFGLQPTHLILIAVIALIIFGPSRLPEIGRSMGKSINEFREGMKDAQSGFKEEVTKEEPKKLESSMVSATTVVPGTTTTTVAPSAAAVPSASTTTAVPGAVAQGTTNGATTKIEG